MISYVNRVTFLISNVNCLFALDFLQSVKANLYLDVII